MRILIAAAPGFIAQFMRPESIRNVDEIVDNFVVIHARQSLPPAAGPPPFAGMGRSRSGQASGRIAEVNRAAMIKTALLYGLALAAGAILLRTLEYRFLARTHSLELYLTLLAIAFMALGIWVGASLFRRSPPPSEFESNSKARQALGISEREFQVLCLLTAGRSNKEIAGELQVSPNTVKTHVARLYEKLAVRRRTEAVLRARELGMIR
jgi:ATP/maltotriose-dependent transcriptional regulator MalT